MQNFWIAELVAEKGRFEGHRLADALPGYVTSTCSRVARLFERIGEFNAALRLGDGTDWFLRAAEEGAVMDLLPDVLVYRRMHENNISMAPASRRMSAAMQGAQLIAIKASLDRRRQKGDATVSLNLPTSRGRVR